MMEKNKIELNTLILASILHDLGKPFQFANLNPKLAQTNKHRHPAYSQDIFDHLFFGKSKSWITDLNKSVQPYSMKSIKIDWELCENLINSHHQPSSNALHAFLQAGDQLSASERVSKTDDEDDPRQTVMESVISSLSLTGSKTNTCWYQPVPLTKINMEKLLLPSATDIPLQLEQLRQLCSDLLEELQTILTNWDSSDCDTPTLISMLDLWSYKIFWMWPSTRWHKHEKDISLYDHARVATAISACLYHQKNLHTLTTTKDVKDQGKFRLLQCDFSGIQKYIFDIQTKSAAKRLRARSFFVQTLTENTLNTLLNQLDLPIQCALLNAGGKFLLLLPPVSEQQLTDLKNQLEEYLLKSFQGQIQLNMLWSAPFSGTCLSAAKNTEEKSGYLSLLESFKAQAQEQKYKAFSTVWKKNQAPQNIFVRSLASDSYECKGCSKPNILDEQEFCESCASDTRLGSQLVSENQLVVYQKTQNFKSEIKLVKRLSKDNKKPDRITIINPDWVGEMKMRLGEISCPLSLKFMANYIPVWGDELKEKMSPNQVSHLQKTFSSESRSRDEDLTLNDKQPLHFQAIAELSEGNPMLGILKADVDNLGRLFAEGIKPDRYTVTRIATFSRLLDLFFSGYLETLIRRHFPTVYCVYAGGDDLLLIGPWSEMLKLAGEIRDKFNAFTGNNPDVTLSTGLAFVKPKFPILRAVELAEDALSKAKNMPGKNAVCLWDKALTWLDYAFVLTEAERLSEWIKTDAVTSGFARNLLTFGKMQSEYLKKEKKPTRMLRWKPLLAYQIGRNIKNRNIRDWIEPILSETSNKPDSQRLKEHLELIATIAIYKNR